MNQNQVDAGGCILCCAQVDFKEIGPWLTVVPSIECFGSAYMFRRINEDAQDYSMEPNGV